MNAAKDDFLDTLPHQSVSLPAVERHFTRPLTNLCNTTVNFGKFVRPDAEQNETGNTHRISIDDLQMSAQPEVSRISCDLFRYIMNTANYCEA